MEQIDNFLYSDTIVAVATPPGTGGIAVIRISGPASRSIFAGGWKGRNILTAPPRQALYGNYFSLNGNLIDEGIATVFIGPHSFTGEDTVEFAFHGSKWIQREIIHDLIQRGARMANPGEFTQRAFLNGRIDLAQAEGVADLIASSSRAAHQMALTQTKGSFSKEFSLLRNQLIDFASLLELELDFSEEDVEFAQRSRLRMLCDEIQKKVDSLADSYSVGAVIKDGITVVIAGVPNAGKSSLLNQLLKEEKAIVTDIPGTTRDIIEDTIELDGILYRFIDTAGLRNTNDVVEGIGVDKARQALKKAHIIIWVIDSTANLDSQLSELKTFKETEPSSNIIILYNKSDIIPSSSAHNEKKNKEIVNNTTKKGKEILKELRLEHIIDYSTVTGKGYDILLKKLKELATEGKNLEQDIIVTNGRHYEALIKASKCLSQVKEGLENSLPADLLAQDLRQTISFLGEITGNITTDTLLQTIFSRFCIGK